MRLLKVTLYRILSTSLAFIFLAGAVGPVSASRPASVEPDASYAPQSLPPALVEASPISGSELPLQPEIILYFNQAMDQTSLEAAVQSQPALDWEFEWADMATVKTKPTKPLSAGTELTLAIASSARALNGLGMTEAVTLTYHTAQNLFPVEKLPADGALEVDPAAAVAVTFNQPVTPLSAEEQNLSPAFTLDPSASGRGEWLNTSTYVFYPEPPLMGGKTYTVSLNTSLVSTSGASLKLPTGVSSSWNFKTAAPKVTGILPVTEFPVNLDEPFSLEFNQPMDSKSVEQNFQLTKDEKAVPGKITWNKDFTKITFQPSSLLARKADYTLTLSKVAAARGGTALGEETKVIFRSVAPLAVSSTEPIEGQSLEATYGYAAVTLHFTAPLKEQDLTELVSIEPAVGDVQIYIGDPNSLIVAGYFETSTEYQLKVSSALKDRWGDPLGKPFTMNFSTARAEPSLTIPAMNSGGQVIFLTPQNKTLPAYATNLSGLVIDASSLSLSEFIRLSSDYGKNLDGYAPAEKKSWNQDFKLKSDRSEAVDITLTPDGEALSSGLYYYSLQAYELNEKGRTPPPPFLAVVSNIHITFKRSASQAFVWAVNLQTNQPVSGAEVSIYDKSGKKLSSGVTDEKGVVSISIPSLDLYDSLYALLGDPTGPLFGLTMDTWSSGISGWNFGLPTYFTPDETKVYLYTDRPIYRPGDTVSLRAVVREASNGRYALTKLKQLHLKMMGTYSQISGQVPEITSLTVPILSYGTAAATFDLPDDAAPGDYSVTVEEAPGAYLNYRVAEYRKPEVDLQVTFKKEQIKLKEDIGAVFTAKYYFGVPVSGLSLHWALYSAANWLDLPNGYQSGKQSLTFTTSEEMGIMSRLGTYLTEGNVKTGADGTVEITIPASDLPKNFDPEQYQQFTLEISSQDETISPVSARASLPYYPSDFAIGVRAEAWSVPAGTELGYSVVTVDWQKQASPNRTLKAIFQKITWKQEGGSNSIYGYPQLVPEYTLVSSADLRTDEKGVARLAFTPPDPGTYLLDVRGDGAVTQALSWVSGKGATSWPMLPNQHLTLNPDAKEYKPGETAHIFIPNPLGASALALITVERSKVISSQVVQISSASYELELPLTDEHAPNVYLSVTLLGTREDGMPDFRQGYLNLKVAPDKNTLQVSLTPTPEQARPGEEVSFAIQVKDSQGEPVQGEFSLAVVDKALLALAEPNAVKILEAFYGNQPLGVNNALSLAAFAARNIPMAADGKGGGGDFAATYAPRKNFKDTAYWNAQIETDASGKAEVSVPLPDNLTTWVATLRGLDKETRVGETTRELVTSKELMILPSTPRFLVVGDHVAITASVINNTAQSLDTEVGLQTLGLTLDSNSPAVQNITLAANDRQTVTWWGTADNTAEVNLTFQARGGNLSDAAVPETGPIPVYHYSASQTFATSGILNEGGQKTEVVDLPRSFTPTGGEMRVEVSPSLAAAVLKGLQAMEVFPTDYTEAVLSRFLPNLVTYRTLQDLKIDSPELKASLETAVRDGLARLMRTQNNDGGWGWMPEHTSSPYLTAYVLFGLSQAVQSGYSIDKLVIQNAQNYLTANLPTLAEIKEDWMLDRLAFEYYALQQSGITDLNLTGLYGKRDRLSPWAQAFLAMALEANNPQNARQIYSDLGTSAKRSATGAHWEDAGNQHYNLSTANFSTAVVIYALVRSNPQSPLVNEAVRYLVNHRRNTGCWASSYESAWALLALSETMRSNGDLKASFAYAATLNQLPLLNGKAGGTAALETSVKSVPLTDLTTGAPNDLTFSRDAGDGNLYYRVFLQVDRPADSAAEVQRGIRIERQYQAGGLDCKEQACPSVNLIQMGDNNYLNVRLTITVPEEMQFMVVEDYIPAGMEIPNTALKTTQLGETTPQYNPRDPFAGGWGWWIFGSPTIYDDHIRWVAESVPAGTYTLTYKLQPTQAGDFRVIPAHAYQYYFPEVEGSSAGNLFSVQP